LLNNIGIQLQIDEQVMNVTEKKKRLLEKNSKKHIYASMEL